MLFIILAVTLGVAAAAPQNTRTSPVPILRQDSQISPDGSYQYIYETGNGISAEEKGALKTVGKESALEVTGQFQYPGDGGNIRLTYIANENGFQPSGAHLPVAPPIPPAIQKALAYLATAPPPRN